MACNALRNMTVVSSPQPAVKVNLEANWGQLGCRSVV